MKDLKRKLSTYGRKIKYVKNKTTAQTKKFLSFNIDFKIEETDLP